VPARPLFAIVAAAILLLIGRGAEAACTPTRTNACVNLSIASDISKQIVLDEERGQKPGDKTLVQKPADPAPYTGPTLGVSSMVRRAPTVGYRWSLE